MTSVIKFLLVLMLILLGYEAFSQELHAPKEVTSMNETLSFGGPRKESNFHLPDDVQVSFAVSALGYQSLNESDGSLPKDLSNLQVILQRQIDSIGYFVQVGKYVLPTLAEPIARSSDNSLEYGYVPHAYLSYAFDDKWALIAGKLLAMPGFENPFTFQNQNIQRGILERHNNTITRGVQLNYKTQNKSFFVTTTDGFYSGSYSWLGVGGSVQFSERQNLSLMWSGASHPSTKTSSVTPLLQNNSEILNLNYYVSVENWSITPYYQYTRVPVNSVTNLANGISTRGFAMIINYHTPQMLSMMGREGKVSWPLRIERLKSAAEGITDEQLSSYTNAQSLTFTPTWQSNEYFLRAEISRVKADNRYFFKSSSPQRFLLEVGLLH